jgi:hypothetical protein
MKVVTASMANVEREPGSDKPALPCCVATFSRTTVNEKVDPSPGVDVTPMQGCTEIFFRV